MRIGRRHAIGIRSGISVSALALALFAAQPAMAQSDVSTLQGHVDGAAAGAQVIATDRVTGQRVAGTVDANGDYKILGVRPSTYDVTVEGKGSQTTTILVGQTATLDFVDQPIAAAPGAGDIVVTGSRSITTVRTQSVTTNITPAQIENLPQNQRNFLSFADLAPGLDTNRGGTARVAGAGSAAQNANVLIDGLSFKNPINHGGVVGQTFGIGNPFPQSAIQEYKIDTQNFGAETGQVGSALVTAVTKTGGNSFHGSAFVEFQPRQFIDQPFFDKENKVPKGQYDRKQFGAELGGPIIPGVLSFYVTGEGTATNLPSTTAVLAQPVPNSVSSQVLVPRNGDFHQGLYFGKLTWFAGSGDTVNVEAYLRRENNLNDIAGNAALSHGRTIFTHQDRYQLNWSHRAGDLLNVFNAAYDTSQLATPSYGSGPEYILSASNDFSEIALLGAAPFTQSDRTKSYTFKDDVTLAKGDHTLKAGAQLAFLDLSRTVADHFNGTYYYANPGAGASFDPTVNTPYGYRINTAPTPTVAFKDVQIGFYLQDEWQPNEHWTINAGLRWDLETNANNNNYVTPAKIATALGAYQGWKARGINPEDYISTGSNRKPEYGAFQPRFGVAYDVNGDRDLVLFAGAGRYFDRSLFIEGVIETLTNSNNVITGNFCSATITTGCTVFTQALRDPNNLRATLQNTGTSGSVFLLNNKTRLPFSDQFDIGIRKRFGQIQTSITYSHIRSHNIFQFVRSNFYSNGWYTRILQRDAGGNVIGCTDGGDRWIQDNIPSTNYAACPAMNGQLTGFSGKLDRGASDGRAIYNAVYLKAEKPFTDTSRWGFTTALTIQIARTNNATELDSDEFFNGPSQTVYGDSFVRGVDKYKLVSTANWRAPYGFILSGNLTLASGPSFGNIYGFGNATDGACCYGNLAGVFYPKPFIGYKRLDLRIAKTFRMPWDHGHELTIDFQAFNVFNWLNRDYSSWGAGGGKPAPLIEKSQIGNDQREFQAGLKYKF